ncbi:MAG TPA: VWA domain-containing protein [Acidisarcina sp.]
MIRIALKSLLRGAFFCGAAMIVCRGLHAQEGNSGSHDLVLKQNVRRVIVDVVVTDAAGKAVRGLQGDDFSLEEDGKPQRVLSFDNHELEPLQGDDPPHRPALPANTYLNLPASPERGPLYVLLLDLANTDPDDQETGRIQLLKFIDSKPAGIRFAVFVVSDDLYLIQGFTSDKQSLYAALDPHHPTHHIPMVFLYGSSFGGGSSGVTLEVLRRIGNFVDGLPGRKNLIWLSGAFPLNFAAVPNEDPDFIAKTKAVLDTFARNQVSIYPLDVRGLMVASPKQALAVTAQFDGMEQIAKLTGGHAFYSNNGIADELQRATDQGGTYYELSYSPANRNYKGEVRNIRVNLAKKGYSLSYRHSYYAVEYAAPTETVARKGKSKSKDIAPLRPVGDSLFVEMQHGAPLVHDLLFKVHVHALGPPALATPEQMSSIDVDPVYFQKRHKDNKAVKSIPPVEVQTLLLDFTLSASQLLVKQADGETMDPAVEIAAAAYDGDGKMLNGSVEPALEAIPFEPGGLGEHRVAHQVFRLQQQIDVPAGSASIRIAVRDMRTDHVGAIELPLPLSPESLTTAALP